MSGLFGPSTARWTPPGRAGARGKGRAVPATASAGCGRARDGRGCGQRCGKWALYADKPHRGGKWRIGRGRVHGSVEGSSPKKVLVTDPVSRPSFSGRTSTYARPRDPPGRVRTYPLHTVHDCELVGAEGPAPCRPCAFFPATPSRPGRLVAALPGSPRDARDASRTAATAGRTSSADSTAYRTASANLARLRA
jgi:hypothetical protein